MEYEKCYVFEPGEARPTKKRRIEPQGLQASWKLRRKAYEKAWRRQKKCIDENLSAINKTTVDDICGFLDRSAQPRITDHIPTVLLSTGAEGSSVDSVINKVSQYQNRDYRRVFVSVSSSSGTNLKALLKTIMQGATLRDEGIDDDEPNDLPTAKKGVKLLNYDLRILADHVKERKLRQVVITIQDTEAFGNELLSDLIEMLGCWQDRIPFVFLFCVATDVDDMQCRLSREATNYLAADVFSVAPLSVEIEQVFEAMIEDDPSIWIGSSLMSMLLERQSDYIQSIDGLVDGVQYAYMSSYYANALSIFLDQDIKLKDVPKDHYEAVRNVDSFRSFCKRLLEQGELRRVEDLLESDSSLHDLIIQKVEDGRNTLMDMTTALHLLRELQKLNVGTQVPSKSKLYTQAMSDNLNGSSSIRSLLLSIRKAPSNMADEFVNVVVRLALPSPFHTEFGRVRAELWEMIENQQDVQQPMRSEDDVKNSTLRTTIVAQKVELSKQKSTLSKQDAAYTKLLRKFTDFLEEYFKKTLVDPTSLLFHEIFVYDLKSPHREVFTARPRHAIERALAAPHDYLDCDCCAPGNDDGDEFTLSASQPASAVLYQLYLESGSLINASDLRQAFQAVVGDERTEEQNMALFQRALAETKYLGFTKNTRKRVDHVAKVSWKGL